MKIESTTFFCDAATRCHARVTVCEPSQTTAAYLAMIEKGWRTDRQFGLGAWKHYCPDHLGPKGAPTDDRASEAGDSR